MSGWNPRMKTDEAVPKAPPWGELSERSED